MLLKIIDDLKTVSNLQHDLIRDLLKELENRPAPEEPGTEEIKEPAIVSFRQRAEETERLLDIIEYNNRRV